MRLMIFLSLFLVSCTQLPSRPANLWDAGQTAQDGTAILLNYHLTVASSRSQKEGCLLYLKNTEETEALSVKLYPQKTSVLFGAEPGTYLAKRLDCPGEQTFNMEGFPKEPLKLMPNRINYFGDVVFEFEGTKITVFKYPPSKTVAADLKSAFAQLHPAWKKLLVLPHTQKPLGQGMFDSSTGFQMKNSYIWKRGDQTSTATIQKNLSDCYLQENEKVGFLLGKLEIEAQYENDHLETLKRTVDSNGFSPELGRCIEDHLRNYHPGVKTPLLVKVRI